MNAVSSVVATIQVTLRTRHPALSPGSLQRTIRFIEEHVGERIALEDIASHANISRFHFARLFKQSTGLSPVAYLKRSQIRRARALIIAGDLSLAEVAIVTGFADQSHLTRRFRSYAGCTPGSLRTHR
jgi:AraC family transcriptional regulator